MSNTIWNTINSTVNYLAFLPGQLRVNRWLDTVTQESALHCIQDRFAYRWKYIDRSLATDVFRTYANVDTTSGDQFWDKSSFKALLTELLGNEGNVVLDETAAVLFRCFCFYAYFPFSSLRKNGDHALIDQAGYERAALLLAAGGTNDIGCDSIGGLIHSGRDEDRAQLWRTFKSLCTRKDSSNDAGGHGEKTLPEAGSQSYQDLDLDISLPTDAVDIHDIVVLGEQNDASAAPVTGERVMAAVERIAGPDLQRSDTGAEQLALARSDLLALLQILLQVRFELDEQSPVSGRSKFWIRERKDTADGDHASSLNLARAALGAISTEGKDTISWSDFERMSSLMPHLMTQVGLLWQALLSPASPSDDVPSERNAEPLPNPVAQLLFMSSGRMPAALGTITYERTWIARLHDRLQHAHETFSGRHDLHMGNSAMVIRLIDQLRQPESHPPSFLLLLSGHRPLATGLSGDTHQESVTIGAYLCPPDRSSGLKKEDVDQVGVFSGLATVLLLQLKPVLRVSRRLGDNKHSKDDMISAEESGNQSLQIGRGVILGKSMSEGLQLKLDFIERTAELRNPAIEATDSVKVLNGHPRSQEIQLKQVECFRVD